VKINKIPVLVHTGWWFLNKMTQSWHVVIEAGPRINAGPRIQAGVWFICTDRSRGASIWSSTVCTYTHSFCLTSFLFSSYSRMGWFHLEKTLVITGTGFFTSRQAFLSPTQQSQSSEGKPAQSLQPEKIIHMPHTFFLHQLTPKRRDATAFTRAFGRQLVRFK